MIRFALLFVLVCVTAPKAVATWPGVPFAEVRAYAWPTDYVAEKVIDSEGKLRPGVLNPDGMKLSKSQVRQLISAQARRVSKRKLVTSCYQPRNAFVFRDVQGRMVAFLELCFDCHTATPQPPDENSDPNLAPLAAIFSELKLPFGRYSLRELTKHERNWRSARVR